MLHKMSIDLIRFVDDLIIAVGLHGSVVFTLVALQTKEIVQYRTVAAVAVDNEDLTEAVSCDLIAKLF